MFREVCAIAGNDGSAVMLTVEFNEFDAPDLIQPMQNGREIGPEFPFSHEVTEGKTFQARANKAVLEIIYSDPLPKIEDFFPVLVVAE